MTVNDRITHCDLINLGIVFLEQSEERAFLKRVNDEFAYLVGVEVLNWIKGNNELGNVSLEDVWKLFEKDQEKCSEIIETLRTRIFLDLKEYRKRLLGGGGKQGTWFTQCDSSDNIEIPPQRRYVSKIAEMYAQNSKRKATDTCPKCGRELSDDECRSINPQTMKVENSSDENGEEF